MAIVHAFEKRRAMIADADRFLIARSVFVRSITISGVKAKRFHKSIERGVFLGRATNGVFSPIERKTRITNAFKGSRFWPSCLAILNVA